jgi:hypothetical protein
MRPLRRGATWTVVIVIALAAVTLIDAGGGAAVPTPVPNPLTSLNLPSSEISLLPSGTTGSTCISQPVGSPSVQLPLENGTLQTNVYSPPSGTGGNASLCYNAPSGRLNSYANWTHVGGNGGWFSYPQLAYGVNDYDGSYDTYTNQSPTWALPQSVATTENASLWVTASYNYHPPSLKGAIGYDLSFDNYLSEGSVPTFENGPFIEILVLLAHHLVSHPAGWIAWNMTTLVDASVSVRPWYVGYWCHGTKNSSSPTVTFDYSYGGSAETTPGINAGTVGVNMSAVLRETGKLIGGVTCWSGPAGQFSSFSLGQEVFGSEAGIHAGASVTYRWTESRYCLHVNVASATTASLDCTSGGNGGAPARSDLGSGAPQGIGPLPGRRG